MDLDCSYRGSMGSSTSGALSQDTEAQYHQKQQEALDWHCTVGDFTLQLLCTLMEWRGALQGGTCACTPAHTHNQ
eukprot:1156751-Pelagomonas_calceolata.AAC.3